MVFLMMLKADGKVLIPAFAVGRSQEVILILKDAMERGEIREFPVYVDGMVQKVNEIYSDSDFVNELSRPLQRKAERGENLFYSDVIRPVGSNGKPKEILSGEPCCIIASSGMLIGGKSVDYAKDLACDPKNLIAITEYQAEGTPGRALLDLPSQGTDADRVWFVDDERYEVIGIARGRRHTMERALSEVHRCLLKKQKKTTFHVRELAEFWFGSEAITEVVVRIFKWWLSLDGRFFERDRSSNLFRLKQPV